MLFIKQKTFGTWSSAAQGPNGTKHNHTKHSCYDAASFEDWFENLLVPKLKKLPGIKVVIGINLSRNFSPKVLNCVKKIQFSLPACYQILLTFANH